MPEMPWWTPGAGLALLIAAVFIALNFWLRQGKRRIDQQATADEKRWAEVTDVLGIDMHEYRKNKPYRRARHERLM